MKPMALVSWGLFVLVLNLSAGAAEPLIRVVVWDEQQPAQKQAYENFLGNTLPRISPVRVD